MSSAKYIGAIPVIVFGVGLLITGRIWIGLAVLAVGILFLSVALAPSLAAKSFFLAIGLLLGSLVFAGRATSNEISGRATYYPHTKGPSVTITRTDSPVVFRQVTNWSWAVSVFCLMVSFGGFAYARKLDDCV